MSKEKQIEKMARDLQRSEHWCFNESSIDFELDRRKTAENLYNAGYRKQSEWISVEERLPKHLQKVLVCDTKQKRVTATYISYGESKGDWCSAVRIVNKVTHWMPLPEAPKGGEE